jgi:microcystin-dependent protein
MAAFDFPASPSNGATYSPLPGVTYVYDAASQTWRGGAPAVVTIGYINMPAGMIFHMLVTSVPPGTLELNGQAVSRTTYSNLFAHYGTAYGVGDGTTTFNLPDMDGIVLAGRDPSQKRLSVAGGNDARSIGSYCGAQVVTLDTTMIPSHLHAQTSHTHTGADHYHNNLDHYHAQVAHIHQIQYSNAAAVQASGSGFVRGAGTGWSTIFSTTDGATNTGTMAGGAGNTNWLSLAGSGVGTTGASAAVNTGSTGSGGFHQNMQPTRAAMCLVTTGGQ